MYVIKYSVTVKCPKYRYTCFKTVLCASQVSNLYFYTLCASNTMYNLILPINFVKHFMYRVRKIQLKFRPMFVVRSVTTVLWPSLYHDRLMKLYFLPPEWFIDVIWLNNGKKNNYILSRINLATRVPIYMPCVPLLSVRTVQHGTRTFLSISILYPCVLMRRVYM